MARRTPEQMAAYRQRKEAAARAAEKARARKDRTHRLIVAASTIEAESGIELDGYLATALGRILRGAASDGRTAIGRYIAERGMDAGEAVLREGLEGVLDDAGRG